MARFPAAKFRVGVQLHPQACTVQQLRSAWRAADELGVDTIWLWDHFFPLYGNPDAMHYECYSLLAALAVDTRHAEFGALVTCNSYRSPHLLADMARTIDHLGEGRFILGIGSGWFERDYSEYEFPFGTAASRLAELNAALPKIASRFDALNPQPISIPILIGGGGEKVTLRLVAEHADAWNTFGPPDNFAAKNAVLNEWCAKVGRDPAQIERTVAIQPNELGDADAYLEAGAQHLIIMIGAPFDLDPVEALLDLARG
jgi:probable F420-dependent oxidoreductase